MKDNKGIYRGLGGTKGGLGSTKKDSGLPHEYYELAAKVESQQKPNAYHVALSGGAERRNVVTDTIREACQACLDYVAQNKLSPSEWTGGQLYEHGEKVGWINHEGTLLDANDDINLKGAPMNAGQAVKSLVQIPQDIRESLQEVLQYSWQEEYRDFLDCLSDDDHEKVMNDEDGDKLLDLAASRAKAGAHVFTHMAKLDDWLNGGQVEAVASQPQNPARELAGQYGGMWAQHPDFCREDWQYEVANDDTVAGYWDWVISKIEERARDEEDEDLGYGPSPS